MRRLWIIVLFISTVCALAAETVVVVHPKNTSSYLRKESLEAMFKGRIKNWTDGRRVKLAFYKDSPLQKEILERYMAMSQSQFDNHWSSLIYTGKADEPAYFYVQSEVLEFVAYNEGALGFVEAEKLTPAVKVLKIVSAEEARVLEAQAADSATPGKAMPKAVR